MFKFIQTTPVAGDCTCCYEIKLDKEYTVGEFIQAVLTQQKNEWGKIGIWKKGSWSGEPSVEYSCGKLTTENMDEISLNKKILEVKSNGGWSNMDYVLKCEE